MKDFWDAQHTAKNTRYITGVTGLRGLRNLHKSAFPASLDGMTVLCIGVGDGTQVRDAVAEGATVYGADISKVGIDGVADVLSGHFMYPRFDQMPSNFFDLVFSRAVTCHLDNAALSHHLEHGIRSLKASGSYFIQSCYSITGDNKGDKSELITKTMMQQGGVWRSYEFMARAITKAGGVIVELPLTCSFPEPPGLAWHALHVKRSL